jgi:predicted RNA binding protein YcfA (HicA-like mRNA interferase family)
VDLRFVPARGKGSHGTVYFGAASTVLKDPKKELGIGLLRAMCKDLGISPQDM